MKLARILNMDLSAWEESILAAAWLCGKDLRAALQRQSYGRPLLDALNNLTLLPQEWVRELCLEVLLEP